jgi:hypothetical protein
MDSQRREHLDARIADATRQLRALYAQRAALGMHAPPAFDLAGLVPSLLLVCAAMLGMAVLYGTAALAPVEKTAIGYGAALVGIGYGLFSGARQGRLSQTAFGLGLAAAYLTTYGAFFLPRLRVFPATGTALPVLLGALVAVLIATQLRRSSIAATLAFAAIFLTPPLTVLHGTLNTVAYALAIPCAGAAAVLLLQAHRGWVGPTWTALVGAYLTVGLYLFTGADGLSLTPEQQLRLVLGYLAIVFVVIATATLVTARTVEHRMLSAALLAFVNALVCYLLGRVAVDAFLAAGALRSADFVFIGTLGVLAALSAIFAPRRERLTEAFLASMLIILCWSVGRQLSDAALWIAPAAACFVLAVVYARTGVVFLKALNVIVLGLTFAASLWSIQWKGNLALEDYQVVSNWLIGSSVPVALAFTAAVYAHFTRARNPLQARRWLLQDTSLDLTNPHMALLHAAAGTLIMLALTIFRLGSDPILPYAVAAEAVAAVVLGYLLATPSVRMAGVVLLMAAHSVYYFFQLLPQGFAPETAGLGYPLALAAATLVGGLIWEAQIKRSHGMARSAYEPVSALPYLLGVYLLTNLAAQTAPDLYAPLIQAATGLLLLVVALGLGFGGLKSGALLAFVAAAVTFVLRLGPGDDMASTVAFLASFGVAERLMALLERKSAAAADAGVRSLLVLAGGALAVVAAYVLILTPYLTLAVFTLAFVFALLAALLREARYAWPAVMLFALGAGRTALYDIHNLHAGAAAWAVAAAAATLVAMAAAWLRRRRPSHIPQSAPESTAHGRTA